MNAVSPSPDREEFLARYLAVQPTLRSYLESLVGFPSDADDLVQEVTLVLWREYDRYDPARPFVAWTLGVARNHVARWRRDRSVSQRRFTVEAEEALAKAYQELEDGLGDRRAALRSCVARLGERARELLRLRYDQGLELAEIASQHATSVNAINKALGKIRRPLAQCADRAGVIVQ